MYYIDVLYRYIYIHIHICIYICIYICTYIYIYIMLNTCLSFVSQLRSQRLVLPHGWGVSGSVGRNSQLISDHGTQKSQQKPWVLEVYGLFSSGTCIFLEASMRFRLKAKVGDEFFAHQGSSGRWVVTFLT